MKKWITLLLAAIMIFSMVACTANTPAEETPAQTNATENNTEDKQEEAGAENEQANAPEEEKHLRIGVIIGDSTQDYYNLGLAGIKSAIKEGDELIVYDCSQDISKQYDQINDLISQQVDAIVLAVINADAMLSGLELIHEAGIPCFGYDQQLSEEGTALVEGQIYISDYTIGYLGGQAMAEALYQKNGEYKGKVMTYAASYYLAGELRLKSFNEALADYPDIEVFYNSDEDWASDNAMGVVESVLMANPDMNGFWGWSELPTIGAVQCFQENGVLDKMAITSNECSKTMYDYVQKGYIYSGTELNGFGVGQDIIAMVYDYFDGKEVGTKEANIFNVTLDNLEDASTPFALD